MTKPQPQPTANPAPPVASTPAPAPAQPQPAPPAPAPDYNFSNIQFDFNSSVLRTDAIQYLDHVAGEMRKDASVTFKLNGYASLEGTAEHNMILSADRANAVNQYLTDAGIDGSRLSTKGYGVKHPIASNATEAGREKNRRVEIVLNR
ncbi:OmpA family protein [Mucilaginibacter sp. RS28]|uniref:OmpA family protein n=1 Tax=Mucilaginibacter straminoryzae TaxID=2932774 RepID=A0A9X1WZJ1_9SPHI|nr:OmpA family protein [Mucilaginibacter straminoryzae]MCJ8208313.1 OmpA family protein [Mucilaginibacter straminoryzae]